MRTLFLAVLFLFSTEVYYAGCEGPHIYTDNGVNSKDVYVLTYSVFVNPSDSFLVTITKGNCYNIKTATITLDGKEIVTCTGYCKIKLPCVSGLYHITAVDEHYQYTRINLLLIDEPRVEDTTGTASQSTNLLPITSLKPAFLYYPNPAQDEITLVNESDEIKSVSFYSLSGQRLGNFQVNNVKVRIPLNSFPSGLYFIHVATLSDKIIIKKISIL